VNVPASLTALEARIARTCQRFDSLAGISPARCDLQASATGGAIRQPLSRNAGAAPFAEAIRRCALERGLAPSLVSAVAQVESGFDPRATSRAGARGLMQLMPATARALGVRDPYDPAENLAAGSRLLRSLVERFNGDLPRALAAYNAGPQAVDRYGGIPPFAETRRYVAGVLAAFRQYEMQERRTASQ
jgi:soluble lytic murein transglycosylase-like protein